MGKIRAVLAAILAAGALASGARADIITTVDVLVIEGRVLEVDDEQVLVLVHHGDDKWGRITIPRSRVKTIEYDLTKRLEELDPDDYVGRYRLGQWAYTHDMTDEAISILEAVAGKDGVPTMAHLYLAKMLEGKGDYKAAIERYKKYLMAEPGDEKAKAKIEELTKLIAGAEPAAPAGPAAPAAPAVTEGLETDTWRYERWANKADIAVVKDPDGNKMLRVVMDGTGNSSKIAVSARKQLDLSEKSRAVFSTYNTSGKPIQVALALITASGYHESRPITAKTDWTEDISIDVTNAQYKCQANNWTFTSKIPDLDKVQAVIFLIYNGKRRGVFYLDEIVFK